MGLFKKIDIYLLKNFIGVFFITFVVCIFILIMQFTWMHVNDLVGKGVGISVLMEFFIYTVATVIPLALPLSVLLASLMTFGNLGEKFELTAIKSAGISLFRILQPLAICIILICISAFYFNNNVLPKAQIKLWTLIFSLRQKSPELEVPVGEFYRGVNGYHIYVERKNTRTGMLYNVMIYDFSKGFQNTSVMVADSGRIMMTEDKQHLILNLYTGETFENLEEQPTSNKKNISYRREIFREKKILIDFNSDFTRLDESFLEDQHVSKDVVKLVQSIDSVQALAHVRSSTQSMEMVERCYFGRENSKNHILAVAPPEKQQEYDIDSIYNSLTISEKHRVLNLAIQSAQKMKDKVDYNALLLDDYQRYIRKHRIELHRKFTLAFACLIFFFIGAPLGAIIRKGGLGTPIVISVVMFIIYYIIDNMGYKMAREALWPCWEGMWLSSFVLLPIGIFLTVKAATDAPLLNSEIWGKYLEKIKEIILKIIHKCILLRKR